MSNGTDALYIWRKLEKSMFCHIQRSCFPEGDFFRVKSSRILGLSESKEKTVFSTKQTLVLVMNREAFTEGDFSFELKEGTNVMVFYRLRES